MFKLINSLPDKQAQLTINIIGAVACIYVVCGACLILMIRSV
jgi:hypothetical protein